MRGVPESVRVAAEAALTKKASDVVILDVSGESAFVDFFVVASGDNQRQLVAIVDAVDAALREAHLRPSHVEGYPRQEWVLMDYGAFLVHVFTPGRREFYGLERLWGDAKRLEVSG